MILWHVLKPDTQKAIEKAFPRFKPPKVDDDDRNIEFKPVIRIEDIEATMNKIPSGPGR